MKISLLVMVLILHQASYVCEGKKVLIVASNLISHMRELNMNGEELKLRGHDVYQVVHSKFMDLGKVSNTDIPPIYFDVPPDYQGVEYIMVNLKNVGMIESIKLFTQTVFTDCRYMMEDKKFIKKVKDMEFDIMIVDGFPDAPCRYILPYHLGVPYVYQSSVHTEWQMRIPAFPSSYPVLDITQMVIFSNKMTFLQRTVNLLMMTVNLFMFPVVFLSDNSLLDEYAPGLSWNDLMRKSELFLVTRDHMLEYPLALPPNIITTPGISQQPAKPLPADLEKIFQTSHHGVVVVSFGSLGGDLTEDTIESLFQAFAQIKETVVMRYVGDIAAAQKKASPNLHLVSWLPQNDMLGHNKTVAFVTHCGNNGQYESVYHGVPMLGMPIFAEQFANAYRAVVHGYGLQVESITEFTTDELVTKLKELIKNPIYRQKVKLASSAMKADIMLPKSKMAYWVEHVMEFGGDHLKPSSQEMPLYQMLSLDVLAFLLALSVLFFKLVQFVIRKICRKKTTKDKHE